MQGIHLNQLSGGLRLGQIGARRGAGGGAAGRRRRCPFASGFELWPLDAPAARALGANGCFCPAGEKRGCTGWRVGHFVVRYPSTWPSPPRGEGGLKRSVIGFG